MKIEDIRKYAELMKELDLTALEISESGSVRLERAPAPVVSVSAPPPQAQAQPSPEPAAVSAAESITSPMVGVFYRAPAENAEPFIKVGDRIKKGTVIGIIEAMKLMNEIMSDKDGIVEDIPAANGQTVDFGAELVRLKRE